MRRALLGLGVLVAADCTASAEPSARLEPAPAVAPAAPSSSFGAPIDDALPLTPLADIVAEPERFRDRVVRTEGEIARVCQRAGCWMELRADEGPAVRVPMAGHAFFLPRDSAGRHATMQGRVTIQELSADHRAHLESEGAQATTSALSIDATGVVIAGGA